MAEGEINWPRVYYLLQERFGWYPDYISEKLTIEQIADNLNEMRLTDEAKIRAMRRK